MENGRSKRANVEASSNVINFINDIGFLNSAMGKLSYNRTAEEECNVDDLLKIINNIFAEAISLANKESDTRKTNVDATESIMPGNISHLIKWISCQMACDDMRSKDLSGRLLEIFRRLSGYRRTTQVVLVLAALAWQYGEFWYISEAPSTRSTGLSKGLISLKKQLISDENKKEAITPLNMVVNDLLKLTNYLVGLYKLVIQNRGKHMPELTKACLTIPRWSCETIIAILAAGNYFARLTEVDYRSLESELESLKSSVETRKNDVHTAFVACLGQIARMEYQKYVKRVRAPVDIVDLMTTLLAVESSSQDLIVTGPNDTPVKFESFRNKSVLLIISDLKISMDDIATLGSVLDDPKRFQTITEKDELKECFAHYQTEKETLYELVWIPVVDARHDNMEELQKIKSLIPSACRVDPRKLNVSAATFIKEEWRFKRETIVVVLDPLGWVDNTDAMPMLRIWGTDAYPYTGTESKHLWRDPCNWVQLVVQSDKMNEIKEEYTLFYGGTAVTMSEADVNGGLGIPNLGMVRIENTQRFFIRLRCCLICRLQALQISKSEVNPMSDGIVRQLCEAYKAYRRGGFAILTQGPGLQVHHVGLFDETRAILNDPELKGNINLAEVFKKKINNVQKGSTCVHYYIPDYNGLGDLRCPECDEFMRYDLSFMCCNSDCNLKRARNTQGP